MNFDYRQVDLSLKGGDKLQRTIARNDGSCDTRYRDPSHAMIHGYLRAVISLLTEVRRQLTYSSKTLERFRGVTSERSREESCCPCSAALHHLTTSSRG